MGVMNPGLVMRNVIPVVMAGILGIYGLIVSVIITGNSKSSPPQSHLIASTYVRIGAQLHLGTCE